MKFGPIPVKEAEGAILAHSIRTHGIVLKKGTVVDRAQCAVLQAAGIETVVAARFEDGDIPEDQAAAGIANAIAGDGVVVEGAFTGRANLFSACKGVLTLDHSGIDALNRTDEAITIATLPNYRPVVEGEMIATVKIIPFAVSGQAYAGTLARAAGGAVVSVSPYQVRKVGAVATTLPGLSDKVVSKTFRVLRDRLSASGAELVAELKTDHDPAQLRAAIGEALDAGAELLVVFGASAIADRRDVIPAALEQAGGRIIHFGMPVDPGNLLLLGDLRGVPFLGAPGCARSPKENGFDWVLARLLARIPVGPAEITAMGVGGLLMEIVSRPQPRERADPPRSRQIAAILLAAGRSTRMGASNKLLAEIGGRPLVRIAAENALASQAGPVIVVTGHQHTEVAAALAGLPVTLVHNPDFRQGLSTTLSVGIAAVPEDAQGVLVCLGDMPRISAELLDSMVDAHDPERGRLIIVPTYDGKRGNPVLWSRRFFAELQSLSGDVGARHLIGAHPDAVFDLPAPTRGILADVDTPEALALIRAELERA